MSLRSWVLLLILPGHLLVASAASAATDPCPNPKTCAAFALSHEHWATHGQAPLVISYWVNPRNAMIPAASAPAMVAAAARTWEAADPRIHFRYRGLTTAVPGVADGRNVVGWSVPAVPVLESGHAQLFVTDGVIQEADLVLNATSFETWRQCRQADGACGGHPPADATYSYNTEVQGVVTHELGHWLGLDHPDARYGDDLTMSGTFDGRKSMEYQTLGLGDVLGVRAVYPCHGCGTAHAFGP